MKDNNSHGTSEKNLAVWNDPELEVRLIAMLMGELSPFEEADMEQELQSSPELRLFRDRMIKVMGLVTEVNQQDANSNDDDHNDDDAWSLSPERRGVLLENFAEVKSKGKSISPQASIISTAKIQWRNISSIAACLLVSLVAFKMMFVRKSPAFINTEELVTYSAAAEEGTEIMGQREVIPGGEKRSKSQVYKKSESENDSVVTQDIEGGLKNMEGFYAREESAGLDMNQERVIKPEIINKALEKPSAPSSSMAKVIAAGAPGSEHIPVPEVAVNEPSLDYGDGDAFDDAFGKGSGKGRGRQADEKGSIVLKDNQRSKLADLDGLTKEKGSELDPFGDSEIVDSIEDKLDIPTPRTQGTTHGVAAGIGGMDNGLVEQSSASTTSKDASLADAREGGLKSDLSNLSEVDKKRETVELLNANSTITGAWKSHAAEGKDTGRYAYNVEDNSEKLKSWLAAGQPSDSDNTLKGDRRNYRSDDTNSLFSKEIARRGINIDEAEKLLDGMLEKDSGNLGTNDLTKAEMFKEVDQVSKIAVPPAEVGAKLNALQKPLVTNKKIIPDFTKEIAASEQTHSTFSLNVSDVSYQLAKSVLLENSGVLEADKIRVEEFVNAFDYGDPSAGDKKVNCVVEQCAHPFYQQRNLIRVGMKTGAMGRTQPLRLTILLDNSGSMEREDRAATVVKAMEALAKQLGPQDEVTLMSFARDARLLAQKVKGNEAVQLVDIVKSIPSEGGTNLSRAIEQAYGVAQQSVQEGTMSRIVVITDGAANLGNANPEDLAKSIEQMRQNGIAFDACGVGADGLDDNMLEALTRKGDGRYYFINRPEDADAGFAQKLAGALRPAAKNVKVQVVFNPERVGNYRLIGFEKHRLEKEDFRNDAVDAAEMAAEEAGNALYQVEARPDGKGDVATVFVRFQDMASGQMVERSWSIPYQSNVAGINSATPSMQLATAAGMLGERLKLGEQAGIDLKELNPIFAKLRSHYHSDQEVKDLIRMCEKVSE